MGSSAGETENCSIDETLGRLVWVRRRNGSWWPGQIIGVDELPKSSLLAAKPGTPVKLLGRDDASVDWYNLNKSKRVKLFRCGEFDNCIEKAKAAVSTNKKSVKYARREDAIICALEIENSFELKDNDNSRINSSSKKLTCSLSTNSLLIDDERNAEDELRALSKKRKAAQELSHLGVSSAETDEISSAKSTSMKGKRRKTPNDSEDDGIGGVKRMRGIKDLVLDVASKIKDEVEEETEHVNLVTVHKGNSIASENPAYIDKSSTPSLKKKLPSVANGKGHEFKRRKDRRRTLTKVLEESVMVSVPVICNDISGTIGSQLMAVSERDAAVESVESEGIASDYKNNNCVDGIAGQCEIGVVSNCVSLPRCEDNKHTVNGSTCDFLPLEDGSFDDLYDVYLSLNDDDNAGFTQVTPMSLSGKITIECASLCAPEEQVKDAPATNGDAPESESTSPTADCKGIINYDLLKGSSVWQSKRKRNSRRTTNYKNQDLKSIEGVLIDRSSYHDLGLEQLHDGFTECSDLKIESKHGELPRNSEDGFPHWGKHVYYRETIEEVRDEGKVPTRSLPYRHSRLVVPSKYEEADFPTRNTRSEQGSEPCLHDVLVEFKAAHRSHHVPIVSFMSKFNGKAIVGHPLTVESVQNGYSDELHKNMVDNSKHRSAEGRVHRKQSKSKNRSKKGLLKKDGPSSKKTKRLSALSGSRKSREDERNLAVKKLINSAIACIPVNVVFSRLNEAVNGLKQQHS